MVRRVQMLLGTQWRDDTEAAQNPISAESASRPIEEKDVLVVAPYNAQVAMIRSGLSDVGLTRVDVGTVDKFQGREAPVVMMSMTASAIEDVPRGMSFLLSRNRLNVALSRGQWCAIVIRSSALTDHLPSTPDELVDLGAFLRLTR